MIEKEREVVFRDGPFKDDFQRFIHYKQGLGFSYGVAAQKVASMLNDMLNEMGTHVIDKAVAEAIAARHGDEALGTQAKRASMFRQFAVFLNDAGIESYIIPFHYQPKWIDGFAPYVFSYEQIANIFEVSDSLAPRKRNPLYHLVWPAVVRTLYSCGMRLGEVLTLKTCDINLNEGIIFVEKGKNGTSRYVPMSASLHAYCIGYASTVHSISHEYFFPAGDGGRYSPTTARSRIKSIYEDAGIPRLSNGRLPRVHDLRHTFCCHALEQMSVSGFDLYYALPLLSKYVGHYGIRDTERYLRLPAFMQESVVDGEEIIASIIPEVVLQ